jgi:hypothetical protein
MNAAPASLYGKRQVFSPQHFFYLSFHIEFFSIIRNTLAPLLPGPQRPLRTIAAISRTLIFTPNKEL